ncbi:contact-dependent growth inhibition system immunity protein [Streptomyces sp. NPDC021622]|uniref:contact-dependent growth inhibition system immunity protein n=1 Tax=Streptomyces sp. NPDC021622 TaxID=3155013 RepID=UPI0033ECA976
MRDATSLVRRVHELRRVPPGELGPADLRALVFQQVALPYVLPLSQTVLPSSSSCVFVIRT